jgi:amino acid adenylation domain-containing protein
MRAHAGPRDAAPAAAPHATLGRPDEPPASDTGAFGIEALERPVADRFEEQAARHADRDAIRAGGRTLTYRALDEAANGVARALLERGIPRVEPVALLLEDGVARAVAMLGALKAGRIFVPLDTAHPPARLAEVLDDALARTVLCDGGSAALARRVAGEGRAVLDAGAIPAARLAPPRSIAPSDPAYILYTSGTAGGPKGVLHSHRNLLGSARNSTLFAGIGPGDRLVNLHSTAVGASMFGTWGALLNGALALPFDVRAEGFGALAALLAREEATILLSLTTLFRRFVAGLGAGAAFPSLRLVRLGGDAVHPSDVAAFRERFPARCVLANWYGATEAHGIAAYAIGPGDAVPGERVPVGRPLAGVEVRLLDPEGRPAAPGAAGEIAVLGRHLALGYWRRPDLTEAAFRPAEGGARLYRTGDLGRFDAEGRLVHLGRADDEVKVRGVRVAPAEVESALLAHPALREAAVIALEGEREGEGRLAAYVVPREGAAPPPADALARFLGERLPGPMVPSDFVALERLPLLPGGKVDRRALPRPAPASARAGAATPARDQVEDLLLASWESVLDRRPIGVDDDFFDMGGDSLAALSVCARLEAVLGRRVPPAALLRARTVAALAPLLREGGLESSWRSLVPLSTEGSARPLFLVHPRPGYVVCYEPLARALAPRIPVYGLQARGLDGREPPDRDLAAMARHYVSEMRTVEPRGPYFLGGWCTGGLVALEMARLLEREGERVGLVVLCDTFLWRSAPSAAGAWLAHIARGPSWAERAARARELARLVLGRVRGEGDGALAALPPSATATLPGRAREEGPLVRRIALAMRRTYRPRPFTGRLLVLESGEPPAQPHLHGCARWLEEARGEVELVRVPHGHYAMLREPGVREVAEALAGRMLASGAGAPREREVRPAPAAHHSG